MKYFILITLCVLIQAPLKAQDQAIPEKGFVLRTKTNTVEVTRGSSGKIEVEILNCTVKYKTKGVILKLKVL
jgi:hypothetical protein